jgi:Cu/Zn superoxide dismutase
MAIAALAASAVLVTPTAAYAHNHGVTSYNSEDFTMQWAYYRGALTDLRPTTNGPLDGATATAVMVGVNSTRFTLRVTGIDANAGHGTFGAHLHMGPCVEGDYLGEKGLGHYNTDILAVVQPPKVSPQTEVWLDFKANSDGDSTIKVTVPFIPEEGERSIVIHDLPTDPATGKAGDRLACLPLNIKQLGGADD